MMAKTGRNIIQKSFVYLFTCILGFSCHHILRFNIADAPERQFESGISIGGHYPCRCRCSVDTFNNIRHSFRQRIRSLEDIRIIVSKQYAPLILALNILRSVEKLFKNLTPMPSPHIQATSGPAGREIGRVEGIKNLNAKSLRDEIWARKLASKVDGSGTVKDMRTTLNLHLAGVRAVPAICSKNPEVSLTEGVLKNYETVDCEALHDLKGMISSKLR